MLCFDIVWEKRNRCQNHGFFFFFIFHFANGGTYATHIEITAQLILWTLLFFVAPYSSVSQLSYFMKYRFRSLPYCGRKGQCSALKTVFPFGQQQQQQKKPNQFLAHRNRNQIDWESLKIGLPLVISLKPGKVAKLVTHCHSRYFDRKVNAEGDFVESFCRLLTENALTLK